MARLGRTFIDGSPVPEDSTFSPSFSPASPPPPVPAERTVDERRIEVESIDRSLIPDLSEIPEDIRVFLESTGRVLSLASSDPNYIAARTLCGSYPVNLDHDVEESQRADFKRTCIRRGFLVDPTGVIRRGDCLLYVQDSRDRDAELDIAARVARSFEFSDDLDVSSLADKIPPDHRKNVHIHITGSGASRRVRLS